MVWIHALHLNLAVVAVVVIAGCCCSTPSKQMKDEALDGNKAAAEAAAQRGNMLMNALWSIVGGGRAAESNGERAG